MGTTHLTTLASMKSAAFEVQIPKKPVYVGGSGPAMAPLSILPSHHSDSWVILDAITIEGVPFYNVSPSQNDPLRRAVRKNKILDWVSPRTVEDFEYALAVERERTERRIEETLQKRALTDTALGAGARARARSRDDFRSAMAVSGLIMDPSSSTASEEDEKVKQQLLDSMDLPGLPSLQLPNSKETTQVYIERPDSSIENQTEKPSRSTQSPTQSLALGDEAAIEASSETVHSTLSIIGHSEPSDTTVQTAFQIRVPIYNASAPRPVARNLTNSIMDFKRQKLLPHHDLQGLTRSNHPQAFRYRESSKNWPSGGSTTISEQLRESGRIDSGIREHSTSTKTFHKSESGPRFSIPILYDPRSTQQSSTLVSGSSLSGMSTRSPSDRSVSSTDTLIQDDESIRRTLWPSGLASRQSYMTAALPDVSARSRDALKVYESLERVSKARSFAPEHDSIPAKLPPNKSKQTPIQSRSRDAEPEGGFLIKEHNTFVSPLKNKEIEIAESDIGDEENVFEIKGILADKVQKVKGKNVRFYLVDWVGATYEPSWEPAENLTTDSIEIYENSNMPNNPPRLNALPQKKKKSKGSSRASGETHPKRRRTH